MIKRLLTCLSLTKIILVLLVTILTQSLWAADDNYGIIVAGITINSSNASDVLGDGDGETGSVSFDKNTNTLTLDGATINMQGIMDHYAVESSINDLNVKLLGYTSITIDKNSDCTNVFAYTGESNAAQLTLETEANSEGSYGKLYVSGISDKEYITKGYTITNQLQNSGEQTGWKYTEQSGTYSSVYIMFTEYYDLWIGGAHITSDNLMPVSGGTKYIPSTHTLHLAGYGYSDAISSKMQELIVEVDGENSLSSFSYIGTENGRIVFRTAENSQSTNTVNLQKDNGGVITGFYQVVIEEPLQLNSPGTISELSTASSAIISNNVVEYSIRIAGIQVNNKNASSGITGEGITGTIKYDNDTHTLTLNNATITPEQEAPGIDYHGSESLIIELIGTNKIISSGGCDVIQCSSILDIRPDITLKNGDGNPCSLELEGGSGNIISGFRNISGLSNIGGYGNNLVLVYDKDVCYVQNDGLYSYGSDGTGAPGNPVSNATIATDYHLRIGNVYVTNLNKDNVLSNTSNDGKLSYSPQTNTLSFNGAEILQKISIEQENLTIDLEGNNSITIKDEPKSSAIIAETCSLTIKSTSKTGSLTLSSSGECPLTQGITPTITKPLVSSKNIANEEVTMATIHPVYPPIASNTIKTNEGIFIYLENSEDNGGSGIIKYSIKNADKSTGISNQTFSPETGISMTKPGTLTAWIELDSENKSTDLVGKFFGFKQKSIRKVYNGTDAVTFSPEIVPEIEDGDNITVTYEKESGNATVSENAISMSSYGSSMIAARLSQSYSDNQHTYKLNPDTIQIKVIAVPATPSIPEDNSIFLSTDKITISSTSPSGTTIYYKWDNGADKTYTNEISIEGSTLSAWVKYQPYSDAEPVYSDTISATYAIKTNIEGLIFTPSTITDIPYTSSAITPDFTISTQDGTTLTTNDYTLSYKQVVENTPTAVESAINVGSYILTIEGKGSYGGTKEMPFNIVKATLDWTSDSWTVPEPKSELNYTGEALDLITRASIPEGATIKYLTVFNPESYDYIERANEEWSTTTPTGNAPGNYAIFYKIEGGDNFEDWGPSEVGIKATIEKGKVSITAEDIRSTYTGEPITFDKNKVEISISSISKDGINFKYYVPNADNPEEQTLLDNAPTNIGIYNVEISLNDDNYSAEAITATLTIAAQAITSAMVTLDPDANLMYDGNEKHPAVIKVAIAADESVGAAEKVFSAETDYNVSYSEGCTIIGDYTATVTFKGNYSGEATATFTITAATMNVTSEGHSGSYDGEAHGIKVTAPEDATVKYRNQEGTYELTETPTYINAGSYEVYYQVTMDNYTTVTGSATVEISKADITPTVTLEGWTYGATANTPTITGNSGEGTVTYTYKAEGAETFVETAPETAGNYTIKASIAETANYNAGEATTEFTITAATMNITAEGYEGTYDTQAHGITIKAPEGAVVKYRNQEGTYTLTEAPTYTNAGTYEVHYQVTMDNYTTVTSSATVKISKADITPTVTLEGWTYGTTAKTPSITGNPGEGTVTYSYKAEGAETFGKTAPEIVGTHTIKASIAETTNYNAGEATATFTITAATMEVTAEGYEGTYDTQAHGIKVTAPEDATVNYGSQEGTYNLQNSPTYTDAGTYTVYYQVTMSNYTTVTGSKTVEISKANITPTVALEGWTYGTTANTPSITGNTGNGNVTYTYKAEGSETFVDTKPEVVGTHTIKASIAETTNYNAGEATAEFTITAATSSVTAKGYKGAYDKQAHGITVTAPEGSTVMYGTQEGTYEQSESPTYTNAGNYTVYYQVTKENYTTVTGSVTIEISKADITPTVTLEGWTYGTTAKTPSITGNTGEGTVTYTYKAEGADAFGETAPEVVGTHTVKASIAETTNYNAGEATATFTITAATMTVSAAGHEGTYDNKAHGITVTAPEGSKVMYGSQNGTYNLTEAPTYTDAGTYEVYYQVTMNNYTTVTGSETVNISKAAITPTVTLEGWTYGTTAKTPSITGNTGEGTVTYSYKAEGTESFVETKPLVVGTHTVKASIAETTNYNAGEATTTFTITAATMTITAAGHEGTYDGKAHGITVTAPEDATIKYGEQEGSYEQSEAPTYTDAGTYEVYYQVTMDNYTTVTGSATVEISKADITPTVTLEGWTYGATANTPTITGNSGEGTVTYTYKAEGAETFVETAPETAGNYTIKASIAETANYNAGEATTEFTITAATMNITAEGYEGTYDTQAHGITIKAPEGAVVKYRNQEGTYTLTEAPTYTNAGTYEVHYQVTMDNYTTVTSSATVKISKADITPTVSLEGWTYGTTAKSPSVTGNTGEGTVTYTYQAEGAEIFTETMPEVVGTHTIKASIAETTNYNAGEATATFTITAATMTVTAKGYEGTYDGNAHGITVSAPKNATIKYGTAEGSYELNASPEYTTAGNYTVYYQVTMDNYTTVTGSETVKISKAEAELEFDVPEESKVYATIGKEFTEPTLNNLKGLDVTFSSSDESVATVDKNTGKVTLKSAGLTYITATFAGNDNYNEFAVKYELRVKGSYNLWIDNVQVTSDNYNDILENQKFFYDLVNKWLIITNNETPVTVKSSMPELTIYLNGKSELERIYFDNQGNAQNTGTLSFFNYNDVPGKLTLDTNNDNGVISGFSSISFDDNTKLRFIDPDSCEYKDGLVKMTKPSQLGEIVKQVTIGQYIEPMANGDGISFGNIDSETNITNMTIEDKLLITATQHEEGSNEDDDYIDPNNGAFVMNTTNTSEDVEVLSQGVESGNKQPGSEDYADSFRGGITFMIPSGTGTIELELMNEEGYMLMLKIGTGVPHEIVRYERATVVIDYNVDEPTYVYLYLEEKSIIGARRAGNNTRVGKRDKAHGTVFSVKVKAASVSSTNPLNNVEGATGNITIPDVNTTTPSGDDVPTKAEFKITNDENKANDDKWYTINGQRINKPTQKGVYIRNRKKVVVK